MADPFLPAALVVASLCVPPSFAQATGYYAVNSIEVLQPILPVYAGFGLPAAPLAEATLTYWRGDSAPRIYTVRGPVSQLPFVVRARLPRPNNCLPVG